MTNPAREDNSEAGCGVSVTSTRDFGVREVDFSVLVQYLNANDAGPGFYKLAQRKKRHPCGITLRHNGFKQLTRPTRR